MAVLRKDGRHLEGNMSRQFARRNRSELVPKKAEKCSTFVTIVASARCTYVPGMPANFVEELSRAVVCRLQAVPKAYP